MDEIILNKIEKNKNIIKYSFCISDGYKDFFTGKPFVIEYPENIESVPDSILAIPFVANVIPIIWITNGTLRIKELDEDFYNCLPDVKKGYETMFPETTFGGKLIVDNTILTKCNTCGSAMLFSGGLDAINTLVNHLDEQPHLLTIWGADIRYENTDGWEIVRQGIENSANKFNLHVATIHSSFREFDNESYMHHHYYEQLKDSWWHGIKHGIALLSHVAPYAYLHGLNKVYIASTNCISDDLIRCASSPLTDNYVRFNGAKVIHDGFEYSRQDKTHNVVNYVKKTGNTVAMRVCWEKQTGSNCCNCEKCYRTMAGLLAEGVNPFEYGFEKATETLPFMRACVIGQPSYYAALQAYWGHIRNRVIENKSQLVNTPYWQYIKWMEKCDFEHPKTLKMPLIFRIRRYLSKFRFYNELHKIKEKFLHK